MKKIMSINLMVNYPVPRRIQTIRADSVEFNEKYNEYHVYYMGFLIMIIHKENYESDLEKVWEKEDIVVYEISIN